MSIDKIVKIVLCLILAAMVFLIIRGLIVSNVISDNNEEFVFEDSEFTQVIGNDDVGYTIFKESFLKTDNDNVITVNTDNFKSVLFNIEQDQTLYQNAAGDLDLNSFVKDPPDLGINEVKFIETIIENCDEAYVSNMSLASGDEAILIEISSGFDYSTFKYSDNNSDYACFIITANGKSIYASLLTDDSSNMLNEYRTSSFTI